MIQAPQPDVIITLGARLAHEILTAFYLVLSFLGGLLAIYTIRLVYRGLKTESSPAREYERTIDLAERK